MRILLLLAGFCFLSVMGANAQDYSNRGLLMIKEQSEANRMGWARTFDDAVRTGDFSGLSAARLANENYLERELAAFRKLIGQGDGRALLTAINNYLQIERQFVKDAMIPAETLNPGDADGIARVMQKITDFGQKERIFLMEINNAMASEPDNAGPPAAAQPDPEMNQDEPEEVEQEDPKGSVIEGKKAKKKKAKLPHEQWDEDEKNGKKHPDGEEED